MSKSIRRLRSQLHHIKHNPEDFLTVQLRNNTSIQTLIKTKRELIEMACNPQSGKMDKRQAWCDIKRINVSLRSYLSTLDSSIHSQLNQLRNSSHIGATFEDREVFFGLFPKDALQALIETCPF